ncbi:hypothetical protein ACERII_22200 [Evansella sp. AB-rgal1]|uniref:hypothetical protein n=1 Tax=Evansella sp. AB-rgal1 TaxID=3242696 RepID=UPI00359DE466
MLEFLGVLAVLLFIFSPVILSYRTKDKSDVSNKELSIRNLLASKWFGVTFIMLLLFGVYTNNGITGIFSTVIMAFGISILLSLTINLIIYKVIK